MEGKTNPIEDVGIRLVHGLHDSLQDVTLPNLSQLPGNLNLQNINLAPLPMKARERLSKGWNSGWEAVEQLREDWGKRVSGEQDAFAAAAAAAATATPATSSDGGRLSPGLPPASPALSQQSPRVGQSFLAGVDVAKTGAATLATGIGSFFGAQARKTSFFGTTNGGGGAAAAGPTRAAVLAAAAPVPESSSSSSLGAPPAQSTLSTSPGGSFLRPLSTAAAATVQASPPSRSTSPVPKGVVASAPVSPSPSANADKLSRPPAPLGVSGFFGGLRRTLSPGPGEPASAPSTPGTVSTTGESGFGTPPLSSFLGVGGWGASAATSRRLTPERQPAPPPLRARDIMGDLDGRGESSDDDDGEDQAEAERERELTRRKLEGLSTS